MSEFIGRKRELAALHKRLDRVASSGEGSALAIRGRRQVGKSRLVQEFCNQAGVPYVFSTATKGISPGEAVARFVRDLRKSTLLAGREVAPPLDTGSWRDMFETLAEVLPDRPSIVVLDELPWLAERDPSFDGTLQVAWDRLLSSHPVFLLLLGSDVHMMERFTAYDRPFYGRADSMALRPLTLAQTGQVVGLTGADAIDAHLVSGGLPGILRTWPHGTPALDFLKAQCEDSAAPVFGVPDAALASEFANPDLSRGVIEAVGTGDRTHANIAATAGSREGALPSGTLSPLLRRLVEEKGVLAVDEPLSTRAGKPALYRVADSNLRMYLAMLREARDLTDRDLPAAGFELIQSRWTTWRGRAVEPLIRESLWLAGMVGRLPWPDVEAVGGWWNRQFDPEVDLVGADRAPVAKHVYCAGSIKWLGRPFDDRDLAALKRAAVQIPGYDPASTGLAVVSLAGTAPGLDLEGVDLVWTAEDVVDAWTGSES